MSIMRVFVAALLLNVIGRPAHATRMALDPMNRLHAGLSIASPSSMGVMMGMDSRLTQIIYVDVTGFMSASDPIAKETEPDETGGNTWILRHGLYCTPGFRIPHKQPENWSWDILTRAGFGAVWMADAAADFDQQGNPALLGGGEAVVRKGSVGVRLSAKVIYVRPYSSYRRVETTVVRQQYGTEMFYQF